MRSWIVSLVIFVVSFNISAQEVKVVSMEQFVSKSLVVFSKYINWPLNCKNGDFKIAIIGDKAVYNELTKLSSGLTVGSQSVSVVYCQTLNELNGFYHMVYLGANRGNVIKKLIDKVGANNTLVITNDDGMINYGSGINFIPVDGLMKFELSKTNIGKHNLQVHSWLEKMAVNNG